jgi:hypothetical protein
MNRYQEQKARAEEKAQEWQQMASKTALSYGELYEAYNYFDKLAKRYGLKKVFKENGII